MRSSSALTFSSVCDVFVRCLGDEENYIGRALVGFQLLERGIYMFGNTYSCLFPVYALSFSSVCDVFVRVCLLVLTLKERGIHVFMFVTCVRS